MLTGMTHTSVLVNNYDEAIKWYTDVLGLELRSNEGMGDSGYRWVTVAVPGQEVEIVLHKEGTGPEGQDANIHAMGVVFGTNDCKGDIEKFRSRGAKIGLEPETQMWGTQALIEDPYGNKHVFVQPASQ